MTVQILPEETFRLAVEACPSGMIMTDSLGRIVLVNAEVERMFGYTRDELLGAPIECLLPMSMRGKHVQDRAAFAEHPETRRMANGRNLHGQHKDGSLVPVEIGLNPIRTPHGLMILSTVADIAERRLAEAKLQQYAEREQLFIAAVTSSNDAIVTQTLDGVITGWNEAAECMFGFTSEEAIGQSDDIIVPPELRDPFREELQRIRKGERTQHHETLRTHKSGRLIDVSLSISPIKSAKGEIIGATKVARDITAQKRDQRALARRSEELQRSNADLEQFAYVASHDLQEPLRMVATYTELLTEHLGDRLDEKSEKYIRYALDGARRMQQLVKDLLTYSRVDTQGRKPSPVKSAKVLDIVLEGLKIAIEESQAEIVRGDLPIVAADGSQLAQLFQNLIGNALKFHGERPPRIHVGATSDKNRWRFHVADNGIGIDTQYAEVIFQMFQRLHERGQYEGSGIGLAVAKKIVERHGGRIWFESEPDKGTTFYFTLPMEQEVVT